MTTSYLESIRKQIEVKESHCLKPRVIYMDRRCLDAVIEEVVPFCSETGGLASGWQLYGLRVRVHGDFSEPVVF